MKKSSLWRATTLALLSLATATTQAGITTRVSVDSAGIQQNRHTNFEQSASLSADGRYVTFHSDASNLVPNDTNGRNDIFVHDRETRTTTRVNVNSAGRQSNGDAYLPSLSADGRYVTFNSDASNLVPDDTNDVNDIFVHDLLNGSTTRVSLNSAQEQGISSSYSSSLSADGRYVAFLSDASNLVPSDTNGVDDVFVRDRLTGVTTRASVSSVGEQGNSDSIGRDTPTLSADGRHIAFVSDASNLVPNDTNERNDIFVHDRETGFTTRVSVNTAGEQGNYHSYSPALSGNGRYVVFSSDASNLVSGDTNNSMDIFVHDLLTGATTRVSISSIGGQSDSSADNPSVSADGRYVAFESWASNLVPGDTNGDGGDIFVHDRLTGATSHVSVNSAGEQGHHYAPYGASLNADGRYAAFLSDASNLVPGDTNGTYDVFVRDRLGALLEGPAGAASCSDSLDNDSDGAIDSADADCEPIGPLYCNAQLVTIRGTSGSDILTGTTGKDVISGLAGNDVIHGAGGNDVICGGDGNDTLNGDGGRDRLFGGPGDDALNGGNGADRMNGGPGTDRCDGHGGTDTHTGGCETLLNTP